MTVIHFEDDMGWQWNGGGNVRLTAAAGESVQPGINVLSRILQGFFIMLPVAAEFSRCFSFHPVNSAAFSDRNPITNTQK